MASTNKTANYALSQFTSTDKPAWIADYNQDMFNIDAGMKANADADATINASIEALSSKVDAVSATAQTNATNIANNTNDIATLQTSSMAQSNDISNLKTQVSNLGYVKGYFAILKDNMPGVTWKINGSGEWSFVYINSDILGDYATKTPSAQFADAQSVATVPQTWSGLGVQDGQICFGAWSVSAREDIAVAVFWSD